MRKNILNYKYYSYYNVYYGNKSINGFNYII